MLYEVITSIAADGATPRDDIRYVIEIDVLEYHRGSRDVVITSYSIHYTKLYDFADDLILQSG